jgi:deoxyribodipyrimidine photo-lyase
MHNYMRMGWGKKIPEWSSSPAAAYRIAVSYRNDQYELDGRDPNGNAGIEWSMAGKLDRPWFDPSFGQIRYVSAASPGKKFGKKPQSGTTNPPASPVKTVCLNPAGS